MKNPKRQSYCSVPCFIRVDKSVCENVVAVRVRTAQVTVRSCHTDCDRVRVRCVSAITLLTRLVPLAHSTTGADPTLCCEYLLRLTAASSHPGTLVSSCFTRTSYIYLGASFEPNVLAFTLCALLRLSVGVCPYTTTGDSVAR